MTNLVVKDGIAWKVAAKDLLETATPGECAAEIVRLRDLVGRMLPYVQRWDPETPDETQVQITLEDDAERALVTHAHEPGGSQPLIHHMLPMLQHKIVPVGEGHVVVDNRSPEDVVFTVDVATLKSGGSLV